MGARERGVALLVAVASAALLAGLALAISGESRTAVRIAANERAAAAARAAAEGAIAAAALDLARAAVGRPARRAWAQGGALRSLRADGRPHRAEILGAEVALRLFAEPGLIDVGLANPALLGGLLRRIGVPEREATSAELALAAAQEAHRSRGMSLRLSRRVFDSLDAFAARVGLSAATVREARPYLTVASGRRAPDPVLAPEPVYAVLPLSREARIAFAPDRSDGGVDWTATRLAVTLHASARLGDGTEAHAAATLLVDPSARPPVAVVRRASEATPPAAWSPER